MVKASRPELFSELQKVRRQLQQFQCTQAAMLTVVIILAIFKFNKIIQGMNL